MAALCNSNLNWFSNRYKSNSTLKVKLVLKTFICTHASFQLYTRPDQFQYYRSSCAISIKKRFNRVQRQNFVSVNFRKLCYTTSVTIKCCPWSGVVAIWKRSDGIAMKVVSHHVVKQCKQQTIGSGVVIRQCCIISWL